MAGTDIPRRSKRLMAEVLSQSNAMYGNASFRNPVVLLGGLQPTSTPLQVSSNGLTNYALSGHALEECAIEDNIPSYEMKEKVRILSKPFCWNSLWITKVNGGMICATIMLSPGKKLVKPGAPMNSWRIFGRVLSGTARLINYNAEKEVHREVTADRCFSGDWKIAYQVENTGTDNLVLKIEAQEVMTSSEAIGNEKRRAS